MQLTSLAPKLPFAPVTGLPSKAGPAPAVVEVPWQHEPSTDGPLATVRYFGNDTHGDPHQLTVKGYGDAGGEWWVQLTGTLDDAVRAARDFAVVEGFDDLPEQGEYGRTSVAVLDAGKGVWQLHRLMYRDGMGDGMDAQISMPIDTAVTKAGSHVSVPFGNDPAFGFQQADRVEVRFDDPRVKAVVGVDSVALNEA
jgi:hypothetical protein